MATLATNKRNEVLTTKVDKLDEEVRQCSESLQDIKVALAAMNAKYNHILSIFPDKSEKDVLSNANAINNNG